MSNPSKHFEMIRLYPKLNADPATGKVGEIYYNTSINALKLCINSAPTWTVIGESTLPFQDKNALLTEGGVWDNTLNNPASELSFSQDAYIQLPGLPKTSNKIEPNTFTLLDGEVVYVDVNRTATPTTLTPAISNINALTFNSDRLILARCIGTTVIINNRLPLISGDKGSLDTFVRGYDNQNFNLKLVGDGKVFYQNNNLIFENDSYVNIPGLPLAANKIEASAYTIDANEILYVVLNRTNTIQTLTPLNVPIETSLPLDSFVIATNTGTDLILCTGDKLSENQIKSLGEGISVENLSIIGATDWKDKEGQLRILAEKALTPSGFTEFTFITPANKIAIDQTQRSLSVKNLDVSFDGAKINWNTGEIFDYSGVTLLSTFTAPNTLILDGFSRWYSVSLVPGAANLDNEIPLTLNILPATADSTTLKAPYAPNSIQLGQVLLSNVGGTIEPITQSSIIQNAIGAGATGASGPNSSIQFNNLDALAGDADLTWDSGEKELGLGLLKYEVLSLPLLVNDDQSSWQSLISFNKSLHRFVIVEYSLQKSGIYRVGRFLITNDGTNVGFNDDYTETAFSGVNFQAQVSGLNVEIVYTSTLTGANGIFKFSARKWS
jgi:hypothetical protein